MGTQGIRVGTRGTRGIEVGTRGIRLGMRGMGVGMRGIRVGTRGIGVDMRGLEWNRNRKKNVKKICKFQFSFFPETEKKRKRKKNCHKTLIFVLSNEKHKGLLPGSHVKF